MEGYYYTLPATIFYDKKVSANAKLLACVIANFCDRYGKCYATNKYFGEILNRSENTVSRLVSELCEHGYFDVFVDRNDNNKRVITLSSKMVNPILKNGDTYTQKWGDNNTINNNTINNTIIVEIIDYLNDKTNSVFKSNNKATCKLINGRLEDGYTLEDFKSVIDEMKNRWTGTEYEQYLTPSTLFRPSNFEKYLNFSKKAIVKEKINSIIVK